MVTKIAISLACVLLIIAHLRYPEITVDMATLVLLVVAILPWLAAVIRSVELPGGFKIELQDVKQATEKVTGGQDGVVPQSQAPWTDRGVEFLRSVGSGDPNLALVGLRIEIERRLSQLAELSQVPSQRRSAGAMLRDLVIGEQIDRRMAAGLEDLIALGNQAAHGVEVSPNAAAWALDRSASILGSLDDLLSKRRDDRGRSDSE